MNGNLKRNIWSLEREARINKIEIGKSAAIAPNAKRELDIAKFKAGKLNSMVTKVQTRLDRLEDLRSDGSDRPPPLESGSDDSWGPGPDLGRSRRRIKAPRSDHAPSTLAAPDEATRCPRSAAKRRNATNGWVRTTADAMTPSETPFS